MLGALTHGQDARIGGSHGVVDDHAAIDLQSRGLG